MSFSPTLDEIRKHPFMKMRLPETLPNSILHNTPEWFVNENGEMIVGPPDELYNIRQNKTLPVNPRHPLSSFDINKISDLMVLEKTQPKTKENLNLPNGKVKNVITKKLPVNFEIFDEAKEMLTQPKTPKQGSMIEDILHRAATLSISCRKKGEETVPWLTQPPKLDDYEILAKMFESLSTAIDVAETQRYSYKHAAIVEPLRDGGPSLWVTRYVDYTSKYGLGFLLNDGR
jgi:hypothetical protein